MDLEAARPSPHPLLLCAGLFAGSAGLWGLSLALPQPLGARLLAALVPILNGAAAWLFFRRSRARGRDWRFAWLFGYSLVAHGLWSCLPLLPEGLATRIGTESPAGLVLQVLVPGLMVAALLARRDGQHPRAERWRELFDAVIFTTALVLVFWLCGLGELLGREFGVPALQRLEVIYFIGYALLMGFCLFRGLNRPGSFSGSMGWVFAALFAITVGNLAWIPLQLRDAEAGMHYLGFMGVAVAGLFFLAARAPIIGAGGRDQRHGGAGHMLAPYGPILVALPLAAYRLLRPGGAGYQVIVCLSLGMLVLVLGRQLVALWDLRSFNGELEALVQARTEALDDLQGRLLKTQKMNLLATLGAGLAHDMNNLLGVASLSLGRVRDASAEGIVPREKDLKLLQTATDKVSALAANLVSYGRQGEPRNQRFDLNDKLGDLQEFLERLVPRSRLSYDLQAGPLVLEMDPVHLEQIIVNLVLNARDAMPGGGALGVRTSREGEGAFLEISDTGTGIPPEVMRHLFEPFFTTKEAGKGTGLGLASVKAMVEECGAEILVHSVPGEGTRFRIHFKRC